ncbi:MAG: hypothetical protein JSS50_03290 [Proteobacteria bacterium]|nr:hypothetical protein [Pseudomonadota bacterium]
MIANTDYKRELAELRLQKETLSREMYDLMDRHIVDAVAVRILKNRTSALEERIHLISSKVFDDIIA